MEAAKKVVIPTKGDPEINRRIACYLRMFRKEQKITATSVALNLSTNKTTVYRYETLGGKIGIGQYLTVCSNLEVNPVALLKLSIENIQDISLEQVSWTGLPDVNRNAYTLKALFTTRGLKRNTSTASLIVGAYFLELRKASQYKTMRAAAKRLGTYHSLIGKTELATRILDIAEFVWLVGIYDVDPLEALKEVIRRINNSTAGRQ